MNWRSRKYLDRVKDLSCRLCGAEDGTIVPAHYSGYMSHKLGKGMGQKASDHCVAALCHSCHTQMDSYKDGNGKDRAIAFMIAILETQGELLHASGCKG